ncbi:MAG: urease accessory protein UreD [Pseudomarimonas sp.]
MDTGLTPELQPTLLPPTWRAELDLCFVRSAEGTRLASGWHVGPLRVQRLLYPEGRDCAHVLLLHPPGGIAGGDALDIRLQLDCGVQVLATTPGASKWYHGGRAAARQALQLNVGNDACLEWLPQEGILFDGARVQQRTSIHLQARAAMFGWDIVQLGRLAAGEAWTSGHWSQSLQLHREGQLCWLEQAELAADARLRESPLGLAGRSVFATAWASSPAMDAAQAEVLELARTVAVQHSPNGGDASLVFGVTWLPAPANLLVLRILGSDCALVRELLEAVWSALRPWLAGRPAHSPRIWST